MTNYRLVGHHMFMTKKEEIINAFLYLGSEKGFDNVSLKDIADEVGIKKPSLFSHFSSRDEIERQAVSFCMDVLSLKKFDIDPKAETKQIFAERLMSSLGQCFSAFPCNCLLSLTEQKKSFDAYYEDLANQIDLMICARLTVALDFCVQRSWSDINDTDSHARLITPFVREILMGRITSFPETEFL